jgi:catechol 2,3-dioxygenase
MSGVLPAETRIGEIEIRVADLERSLDFYTSQLGLVQHAASGNRVSLGPRSGVRLITLVGEPGTRSRPVGIPGLYHFALLLPSRRDLGILLLHMFQERWPFQGFADHGVSEAAYLADPDGNGIELYSDRPRDTWQIKNGEVAMTTQTLNVNSLIRSVDGEEWNGAHSATRMGHLHFSIADLGHGETFYREVLGFDVTNRSLPNALFLSAGGYHHHIGLNTWLRPQPAHSNYADILSYELIVPDLSAREALAARARSAGLDVVAGETLVLRDPNGTLVLIRP